MSLLARVTRWETRPVLSARAAVLTAPIWMDGMLTRWVAPASASPRGLLRGLALGHALLSGIRLTPVVPADADQGDPFVIALRRIEQDNARGLQTQIRLLKVVAADLPLPECERVVGERQAVVDRSFAEFLGWLAEPA